MKEGTIWTYSDYDNAKMKYTVRNTINVTTKKIKSGTPQRFRHQYELYEKANNQIVAYATLYKEKLQGQPITRNLLFRWHLGGRKAEDPRHEPCNAPPEDDPMEEETLDPGMDPPAELPDP
jgi:hypothetical protein